MVANFMAIVKPLLGYGDLTVFQNGGHPQSNIFINLIV